MIIALVALLGTAALTMDVGFAWYAKRQVQASADAAALAGAQVLPNVTTAVSTANQYATLNTPDNLSNVTVAVTTRCSANAGTWCGPTSTYQANTIAVTETANSPDLVREDLRLRPLQRQGRRDGLPAVLLGARRHHARRRPHGLDVPVAEQLRPEPAGPTSART